MTIRSIVSAFAVLALATPLLVAPASAQQGQRPYQQGQQQTQQMQQGQLGRDRSRSWRETNRTAAWDNNQHNGYYRNNVWHRGPPPSAQTGQRNVTLGYRPWARGQRLGYYNGRYAEVDYRQQNLRAPPRGYHWVRDDSGDYLLAAVVGGLIAQVILSGSR